MNNTSWDVNIKHTHTINKAQRWQCIATRDFCLRLIVAFSLFPWRQCALLIWSGFKNELTCVCTRARVCETVPCNFLSFSDTRRWNKDGKDRLTYCLQQLCVYFSVSVALSLFSLVHPFYKYTCTHRVMSYGPYSNVFIQFKAVDYLVS